MRKVLPFLLPPSGRARGRPKGQEQRSWTGRSHTHTENDGCSLASKEDVDGATRGSEPHSWVRTTLLLATTRHCSLQTTRYTAARMLGLILKSTHMLTRWHPTGRSQRERWLLFSVRRMCPAVSDAPHRRASTGPARGPAHGKQTGRNGNSR